jgi:hypothetical protein
MTDDEFARAFESCELSNESFHHRDHIRLAWIYLQRYGLAEAKPRMAESIRRFAAHHGKSDKYHETVTQAWMQLVAEAAKSRPKDDFEHFVTAFPQLLDKSSLAEFYSDAVLRSEAARSAFVAPDRKKLP